jgi:CheY-like chemotaxis protein
MERWTDERRAGSLDYRGEAMRMPTGIETRLKASRILLVEDNALIVMLCTETLSEMGHAVCAVVATESDAVSAAAQHQPDLMIVDVSLDQGSGVSAIEKILRSGFVPHIFVSGDVSTVLVLRPDAIVLRKPYRDQELAHAIQRALATSLGGSSG